MWTGKVYRDRLVILTAMLTLDASLRKGRLREESGYHLPLPAEIASVAEGDLAMTR